MIGSQNFWIIVSAVSGFLGVVLGAFGVHSLKAIMTPANLEIFDTGIFYHLIHASVMLSISLSGNKRFFSSEIFFLAGIILFSFSLYLYSITSIKTFAMITPFGGISFLAGWVILILSAVRKSEKRDPS